MTGGKGWPVHRRLEWQDDKWVNYGQGDKTTERRENKTSRWHDNSRTRVLSKRMIGENEYLKSRLLDDRVTKQLKNRMTENRWTPVLVGRVITWGQGDGACPGRMTAASDTQTSPVLLPTTHCLSHASQPLSYFLPHIASHTSLPLCCSVMATTVVFDATFADWSDG